MSDSTPPHQGVQLTLAQSNTPCANQINQTENRKQNQFNLNNATTLYA
jgi:hypothetical protein